MAGRGGAGNLIEAANRKASRDLEASQSAAESQTDPSPIEQALRSERKERTVAHSGRGGAGNTYNPSELSQTGKYSHATDTAVNNDPAIVESETGAQMRGRGGAGNFVSNMDVIEGKEVEPLSGRERIRAPGALSQVEQDVEKGLARPDPAYVSLKDRKKESPVDGA